MPNKVNELPPIISYLEDDIFNQPAFVGQRSNLFEPESYALRQQLHSILNKLYSSENLEFLSDLHILNSKKGLSTLELQNEIIKIEKKYIAPDAELLLNIQQITINNIRKKSSKSLNDYKDAINEVFVLIQTNVNSSITSLQEADQRIIINKYAITLGNELGKLISLPTKLPGLLQRLSNNDQNKILELCQQDCKTAQKQLLALSNNKLLPDSQVVKDFNSILVNTIGKLSESFQSMKSLEMRDPNVPKKSVELEKIIDAINTLVKSHSKKRNSDNKVSTRTKLSQTPSVINSVSKKESLSSATPESGSISENHRLFILRSESPSTSKKILPKLNYIPSSRVIPNSIDKVEEIKPKNNSRQKR